MQIDADSDGKIDLEEFVEFATAVARRQQERNTQRGRKATTMIRIGRVKAGVNLKEVKLNHLLEQFWRGWWASQSIFGNSAAQRSGRGIRHPAGTGRRVD